MANRDLSKLRRGAAAFYEFIVGRRPHQQVTFDPPLCPDCQPSTTRLPDGRRQCEACGRTG